MKNLIERAEAKLDEWGAKLEQKNIEYLAAGSIALTGFPNLP